MPLPACHGKLRKTRRALSFPAPDGRRAVRRSRAGIGHGAARMDGNLWPGASREKSPFRRQTVARAVKGARLSRGAVPSGAFEVYTNCDRLAVNREFEAGYYR